MITSKAGIEFLKKREDFRGLAYQDEAGVWTIGFGTTKNVKPGDMLTVGEAEKALLEHVRRVEEFISKAIKVPLTQNQFDALVSFIYNVGEGAFNNSQTMQMLNHGCHDQMPVLMARWRYVTKNGAKVRSAGLEKRRSLEGALWSGATEDADLCQGERGQSHK